MSQPTPSIVYPQTYLLKSIRLWIGALICLCWLNVSLASTDPDVFRTTDYYISHHSKEPFYSDHQIDPTVLLHIREVVRPGIEGSIHKSGRVLLMIHGSTFPASVAFDLDTRNGSLMRSLAVSGWDVFALDLEGYGQSTRPPSMDYPKLFTADHAPVKPPVSLANVSRAIDFIRNLRGVEKVHLLGWSAGAMNEVPAFAIAYPEKTASIVLYGTSWRGWPRDEAENLKELNEANENKINISHPENAVARWSNFGTDGSKLDEEVISKYIDAHLASDPMSGYFGGVRSPSGRMVQSTADKPHFKASNIVSPTLIIRGENDRIASLEDNQALLGALASSRKNLVSIPDGGHFLQYEPVSGIFIKELLNFLNEI